MKNKSEKLVVLVVIILLVVMATVVYFMNKDEVKVVITLDGNIYGEYALDDDRIININDANIVEIKDGEVRMKEAVCPNRFCVSTGYIHTSNRSIVCLPHKLVITIEGKDDRDVDVIID